MMFVLTKYNGCFSGYHWSDNFFAPIAQWIEQWFSKPKVLGSSPGGRVCGGVEKGLSRQAHNLKVVGSNPTSTVDQCVNLMGVVV